MPSDLPAFFKDDDDRLDTASPFQRKVFSAENDSSITEFAILGPDRLVLVHCQTIWLDILLLRFEILCISCVVVCYYIERIKILIVLGQGKVSRVQLVPNETIEEDTRRTKFIASS